MNGIHKGICLAFLPIRRLAELNLDSLVVILIVADKCQRTCRSHNQVCGLSRGVCTEQRLNVGFYIGNQCAAALQHIRAAIVTAIELATGRGTFIRPHRHAAIPTHQRTIVATGFVILRQQHVSMIAIRIRASIGPGQTEITGNVQRATTITVGQYAAVVGFPFGDMNGVALIKQRTRSIRRAGVSPLLQPPRTNAVHANRHKYFVLIFYILPLICF